MEKNTKLKEKILIYFLLQTYFCAHIHLVRKKMCMQNLTFCVYNVVQDEFFHAKKIQKPRKSVLFVNLNMIFLFHMLR